MFRVLGIYNFGLRAKLFSLKVEMGMRRFEVCGKTTKLRLEIGTIGTENVHTEMALFVSVGDMM